ncbi:hypothetical protein Ddye_004687 [Dipteronia dyeriana]|uniref:Reverse transcriptase zinc-binding domain-containing protein n=1 Tax=Dipteronia dyeriana TaxID=168575 RepID=A0AAD9XET9_9ROSI|nr:hypothetical protein Ddye_004687 [Dipteronia dyeriana]
MWIISSNFLLPDSITWHYEGKGNYTAKSGYWLCHSMEAKSYPSSNSRLVKWWTCMLKLKIPLKVQVFVWKTCQDWIPTMSNLTWMGIKADNRCLRCENSEELTLRALWQCQKLWKIRAGWHSKKASNR